jgi:hypothetical protein
VSESWQKLHVWIRNPFWSAVKTKKNYFGRIIEIKRVKKARLLNIPRYVKWSEMVPVTILWYYSNFLPLNQILETNIQILLATIRKGLSLSTSYTHRYLMSRLPLHGFFLRRHVLSTAPSFILWWWKFEILFDPLPRSSSFLEGQRWQPIQMGHSLHTRGRGRWDGLDTILMSMCTL